MMQKSSRDFCLFVCFVCFHEITKCVAVLIVIDYFLRCFTFLVIAGLSHYNPVLLIYKRLKHQGV